MKKRNLHITVIGLLLCTLVGCSSATENCATCGGISLCTCGLSELDVNEVDTNLQEDEIILPDESSGITAFDSWIRAESTETERYKYEAIIEGFVNCDDEIAHGWLDSGTKEFLRLLTGRTDLYDKTAGEVKKIYDSLDEKIENTDYSIRSFFTVDEYGYSVNSGIYSFLRAVDQLESAKFSGSDVVQINENNSVVGWDFDCVGGDAVVADAVGISEELLLILVHAAVDAGFSVNFSQ